MSVTLSIPNQALKHSCAAVATAALILSGRKVSMTWHAVPDVGCVMTTTKSSKRLSSTLATAMCTVSIRKSNEY